MHNKMISLDNAQENSWVLIRRIDDDDVRARLGVFVVEKNQMVFVRFCIGFKGIICLKIQETTIGIRTSDAKKIWVEPIHNNPL